jgi:hypothetical protein
MSQRRIVGRSSPTVRRLLAVAALMTVAATGGAGVLRRTDVVRHGRPACHILFRYAGHEPETLFWQEPCKAVTTRMMSQADLQAAGKWDRLDPFDRKFVSALPGGRVLYVGGGFTASIYPIGTTGMTYEVSVAD